MYYRKFFSGTIDTMAVGVGTGNTALTGGGGATTLYYRSLKTTPVLCNAIVDILKEIGLPDAACSLDPGVPAEYGEIFPYGRDRQGIQVFFANSANTTTIHSNARIVLCPDTDLNTLKVAANSYGGTVVCNITSSLSGNNVPYRFYITVKGDPNSFLQLFIGNYSTPGSETGIFGFGRGKDCYDNNIVCYAPLAQSSGLYFFDLDKKTYINQQTPVSVAANSFIGGTVNDFIVKEGAVDTIALIPWINIPMLGVTLDNCYCVPASLTTATADQAFLIDGEEYWLLRNGRILAKCLTKLQH